MNDLYEIYDAKMARGIYFPHPHRWISSNIKWQYISWLDKGEIFNEKLMICGIEIRTRKEHARLFRKLKMSTRKSWNSYYSCNKGAHEYSKCNGREFSTESLIADKMQYQYRNLILETPTPVGSIDCETGTEIIEIKAIKNWKHALGQVLAYSTYRSTKIPRLHLFGDETRAANPDLITPICNRLSVQVTYE